MHPTPISPHSASPPIAGEPALPHGVTLRPLTVHADERGRVGEFFRNQWPTGMTPAQWAMSVTEAGVVRGVHVHLRHDDYFVLLQGHVVLGLRELRAGAPGNDRSALLHLRGEELVAVFIPHGVAHGFQFLARSTYVLANSHIYDPADELGCHWLDPELGIDWPVHSALLSPRDAALPRMRELAPIVPAWQAS